MNNKLKYIFYPITAVVAALFLWCLCTLDSKSWLPTVGAVLCIIYLSFAARFAGYIYTGEVDEDEAR